MEIPIHRFREMNNVLLLELRIKSKTVMSGARESKKRAFFVLFKLSEETFFNIWVYLFQCIVY